MMSDHEFDAQLQQIQEAYAGHRDGAEAYRDQELARLFEKCRWSQERIAKRLGRTHGWVCLRLTFGRFLCFVTSGNKSQSAPENLTERRFRASWAKTKGSERDRFRQVAEALAAPVPPSPRYMNLVKKPGIRAAVVELLKGRQRQSVPDLVAVLDDRFPGITSPQVTCAVQALQKKPPKGFALEARHSGRSHKYRLTSRGGAAAPPVSPEEAGMTAAEVLPMIREAIAELKKPSVAISTGFALERLGRVERELSRLLVPAGVV